MYYNYFESPVGLLEFAFFEQKLYALKRVNELSKAIKDDGFSAKVKAQLAEYFAGKREIFEVDLALQGTPFQESVWAQLAKIPYGETRSYKDIALAIKKPTACRAVGLANSKNPIMIVLACHRVISSSGALSGYACGSDMKDFLLKLESESRV